MHPTRPESSPATWPATLFAGASLLAAVGWLVSRVWLGLSFADEMQYYGEIAGLVRTGKFFQDDLFVQQLGYLFLLPFFKLHALLFPDQSYLVLFGRLLLLAAYGIAGAMVYRAAGRLGVDATAPKLAALAAFFAWVPFQIFAFSYNSTAYLLVVMLVATWLTRSQERQTRDVVTAAALLTILTFTHPAAGLVLLLAASGELAWRGGIRAGLALIGATALGGALVLGFITLTQGVGFWPDLIYSLNFTRGFGTAVAIEVPSQLAGLLTLIATFVLFALRLRQGRPFRYPLGVESPPAVRWLALAVMVAGAGALLGLAVNWWSGYCAASAFLALLMVLAVSVTPADGAAPKLRVGSLALLRWTILAGLVGGSAALLVIGRQWGTGYFAASIFVVLLIFLAAGAGQEDSAAPIGLAVVGTILGTLFSLTSGNGLHNFGVGAAGVIPFLVLYCARPAASHLVRAGLLAALVGLLLLNGVLRPYGEQTVGKPFVAVTGVPAYRGIRTSPEKVELIAAFQETLGPAGLEGKRVLVSGPHPWLYFATRGTPATAMVFLHTLGKAASFELAAPRLFRNGEPDVIIVTNAGLPPPIAAQVVAWAGRGCSVERIALPPDLIRRYYRQTSFDFAPEIFVLRRSPAR